MIFALVAFIVIGLFALSIVIAGARADETEESRHE